MKKLSYFLMMMLLINVASITLVHARDQIRIVGSSTVFPFSTTVAEYFGQTTPFKTPVVESTGSGGGMKLFCAGLGKNHPDITNASRRIKSSEIKKCAKNGVNKITEVKIGFDGIVLAHSKQGPQYNLKLKHIFLALAKMVPANENGSKLKANPYKKWSDIDPSLPDHEIIVLGPPPTSGTRDAFSEIALEGGCKKFSAIKKMKKTDKKRYKALCHGIRQDGVYVEMGENDNLIVHKLKSNKKAIGIFGFSFLEQNRDSLNAAQIKNKAATFDNIAKGDYPISRSLYFYIKNAHVKQIPGMKEYIQTFTSEKAWGDFGYLTEKGLIPLPKKDRKRFRTDALYLKPFSL